jgi:hypothetical protein
LLQGIREAQRDIEDPIGASDKFTKINNLIQQGVPDVNTSDGSVPPRPASQGGRNKNQDRWDKKYATTHNPDGSMK